MTTIRGERPETTDPTGYEAPFRKSLLDADETLGCPRMAILGLTMLCGIVFLQALPMIVWTWRAGLVAGLWGLGFVIMTLASRHDKQWLSILYESITSPDSLEV